MEGEDIDKIIKDEFEKAKQVGRVKLLPDLKRQRDASHKIADFIFQAIIDEPVPYNFSSKIRELLSNIIKAAKLENGFAHSTFAYIEIKLIDKLENFEGSDYERNLLVGAIDSLNYAAFAYFEEYLVLSNISF